jgi:hypothetical protein
VESAWSGVESQEMIETIHRGQNHTFTRKKTIAKLAESQRVAPPIMVETRNAVIVLLCPSVVFSKYDYSGRKWLIAVTSNLLSLT